MVGSWQGNCKVKDMMQKTIKKSNETLMEIEGGTKMDATLTNDYYLQFNEKYFITRGNSKKDVRENNEKPVTNTEIRLLGRKFCKGLLKTFGEILVIVMSLAICKYAGIYDLWLQLVERLV